MKKLRVGIVGVGGIANGKHMPALAKIPEVEMVAFCDLIKERAEKGAKQYGTSDALVCTDYRELVARDDIDIVHVCTTNDAHSFVAIAALESGSTSCARSRWPRVLLKAARWSRLRRRPARS